MRRIAVVGVLVATGWLATDRVATADAPVQQGWWNGATPLDVLLDALQIPGLDVPLGQVSAVDVPADGLLVQGGTSGPAAYAAVVFDVGTASIEGPLRLEPNPLAVSVPGSQLTACPLDQTSFTPVQGGRRQDAPPYDCLGAVAATVEPDGTYLVDVTTLRRDDRVAIAILPASPSARVVFQAPGDDALPLGPAQVAAAPVDGPLTVGPPAPPFPGSIGSVELPAIGPAPTPVPAQPSTVAAVDATTGADRGAGRVLVFGGIAAAGAGLWLAAGQLGLMRRPPDEAVAA